MKFPEKIVRHVACRSDHQVKEMTSHLVGQEGEIAAIFPFRALDCRGIIELQNPKR